MIQILIHQEVPVYIRHTQYSSSVSSLLKTPVADPSKRKAKRGPQVAGKVLTSMENLEMIAEKEKQKQIALQQKEERKNAKAKATQKLKKVMINLKSFKNAKKGGNEKASIVASSKGMAIM